MFSLVRLCLLNIFVSICFAIIELHAQSTLAPQPISLGEQAQIYLEHNPQILTKHIHTYKQNSETKNGFLLDVSIARNIIFKQHFRCTNENQKQFSAVIYYFLSKVLLKLFEESSDTGIHKIVFLAGGMGSGKTTYFNQKATLQEEISRKQTIVFDSALSNETFITDLLGHETIARKMAQKTLRIEFHWLLKDYQDSLLAGMLTRKGHPHSLGHVMRSQINVQKTMRTLITRYEKHPQIHVKVAFPKNGENPNYFYPTPNIHTLRRWMNDNKVAQLFRKKYELSDFPEFVNHFLFTLAIGYHQASLLRHSPNTEPEWVNLEDQNLNIYLGDLSAEDHKVVRKTLDSLIKLPENKFLEIFKPFHSRFYEAKLLGDETMPNTDAIKEKLRNFQQKLLSTSA